MKKRIIIVAFLLVLMILGCTKANAATVEELKNYIFSSHSVAGRELTLKESQKVQIQRYLDTHDITEGQATQVMGKINQAIEIMNQKGDISFDKYDSETKEELIKIATETGNILNLTVSYSSKDKSILVYEEGKIIGAVSLSGKLVQTGTSNLQKLLLPTALITIVAVVVIKKIENKNNAK